MPSFPRSRAGFRLSTLALAGWLASGVLACQGPQGPDGATGPQGSPGKDGVPIPVRLLDDKVGR